MKEQKKIWNIGLVMVAVIVFAFAVWGPEFLAGYSDKGTLNRITVEELQEESEGYRYALSSNEKLFLLSKCLDNQIIPESEMNALTRLEPDNDLFDSVGEELTAGSYAFVVNYQGPSEGEISEEEIFKHCNSEIEKLKELGIMHKNVKEIKPFSYSAVLYSAIDVLEPRNNMSVWKVSLSTSQLNADKTNRILDLYVDADTGKIYEFYVRTEENWTQITEKAVVEKWAEYLSLAGMEAYETINPLSETTPYFEKYKFPGMADADTVVTVGFYEGINELFVKISK